MSFQCLAKSLTGARSSSLGKSKYFRKPSHLRTKINLLIIIQIQEALWSKFKNLKPLFSRNQELYFQKSSKRTLLYPRSCQPETIRNRRKSKSTCQRKHSFEQAAFWHEVKVVSYCVAYPDPLFTLGKTGYWKQPLWLACYVSLWHKIHFGGNFTLSAQRGHLVMKHCVVYLILLLKQNDFRRRN